MQARSIVEETLKDVERFRILCVGKSGVGKSSLINRVFRLENSPYAVPVAQWTPGHAEIDKEFTSPENNYVVLHDSKGFEAGNTKTVNDVDRFIRQRCDSKLPLKDQLHAVWLCTETPRAGGRVLETGDERLLRLAHDTRTPVVIVFTKYDRLVRTKRAELQEENYGLSDDVLRQRTEEEARKAFDKCLQLLERTLRDTNTPKPHHVNVSDQPGYETSISSLAQVTYDLVSDKLKLMWAIAQRASRQVKINSSFDIAMSYRSAPSVRPMPLRDCLGSVHQDIITCWNFRDEGKTLSGYEFKQLMLYLVQDVQESQNQIGPHVTPPLAIDRVSTFVSERTTPSAQLLPTVAIFDLTSPFAKWLSSAVLDNGPQVQRVLMAYTTDLITVLKSLFDVVTPSFSGGTVWSDLNRVFEAYKRLDPREQTHSRICANFQLDRQISDPAGLRRELRELLEREFPLSGSQRHASGSRGPQIIGAPPASSSSQGKPPSSLTVGMSTPSPGGPATSPGVPTRSPRAPARSTRGRGRPPRGTGAPPSGTRRRGSTAGASRQSCCIIC